MRKNNGIMSLNFFTKGAKSYDELSNLSEPSVPASPEDT